MCYGSNKENHNLSKKAKNAVAAAPAPFFQRINQVIPNRRSKVTGIHNAY